MLLASELLGDCPQFEDLLKSSCLWLYTRVCFIVGKNQVTLHFFAEYSFQVEKNGCAFCIDRVFLLKFWVF